MYQVNTLKKRVGSLEKISKIHVSRHSDMLSMNSRDQENKIGKINMLSALEDDFK